MYEGTVRQYATLIVAVFALSATAGAQLGGLSHVLSTSIFDFKIETRFGYMDCDFRRNEDGSDELLGCTYPDGEEVSDEELVELGLMKDPDDDEAADTQ